MIETPCDHSMSNDEMSMIGCCVTTASMVGSEGGGEVADVSTVVVSYCEVECTVVISLIESV